MDYNPFSLAPFAPDPASVSARNQAYAKPGVYNTPLPFHQENQFRQWLGQNFVPFDPNAKQSDYDMRGFWQALMNGNPQAASAVDPNDSQLHYPDYWKTPMHETFSNQSQWALPGAPSWNAQDQLVTPSGTVQFDDRAGQSPQGIFDLLGYPWR